MRPENQYSYQCVCDVATLVASIVNCSAINKFIRVITPTSAIIVRGNQQCCGHLFLNSNYFAVDIFLIVGVDLTNETFPVVFKHIKQAINNIWGNGLYPTRVHYIQCTGVGSGGWGGEWGGNGMFVSPPPPQTQTHF